MGEFRKAVFISYASEDGPAAQRICDALRTAGLEVWFDQSELRGGDAWDASIRKQIKECALIVPIISAHTDARSEGYFRLEWKLAVERSHLMADDQAYLLPVLIDDTAQSAARVPDRFRERQWSRLVGGETSLAFVENVKRLLAGCVTSPAMAGHPVGAAPRKRRWLLAGAAMTIAAISASVGLTVWHARAPATTPAAVAAPADRKSIAVLPFDNLSGRAEDAYLADGLQEEVLNALARLREFKVISRTSVMEYRGKTRNVREIGERLGVGTILEGSIRRDGNTLRLTVQLIDARDDRHLLAANYDRDMTHVLELQSAVARQVAGALSATLSRAERGELDRVATNSGDAYDRYLRALAVFRNETQEDQTGVAESRRLLQEAVAFDPDYADAQALLSQAHTWTFFGTRRPEDGAAAKQAFERAMATDSQLPEAQLARGLYSMYVADDLDAALGDLTAVVQVRPNSATAHSALGFALRRHARFEEALDHLTRARDLDPLNQAYAGSVYLTLLGLRRFPEAIEHMKLLTRRFPSQAEPYVQRARIEGYLQHSVEPVRAAWRERGNQVEPPWQKWFEAEIAQLDGHYLDSIRLWESMATNPDPMDHAMRIGFLYIAAGDAGRAEKSFRDAERVANDLMKRDPETVNLENLALTQSMLGQHAAALETIDKARALSPESNDAINGPQKSFTRSVILVRAGRLDEGYAEVTRLLHVPFGAPIDLLFLSNPVELLLKDDPHYDELINHPPRL
jgi:TolB-like protein